jgi:hypothetical protein
MRRMFDFPVCSRCQASFDVVLDYGYQYPS